MIACTDDGGCPQGLTCKAGFCGHASDVCTPAGPIGRPRLVAPLSTTAVTSRRPGLAWVPVWASLVEKAALF